MNILITGCLGFIGSHLADMLEHNHNLVGIDNYISHAISEERFPGPVFHFLSYTPSKLDIIIHCASPVGPALIKPGCSAAYKIVKGAYDIIKLAADKAAKLILFSSSEAADIKLADFPLDCRSEYALGKATMECMAFASEYPDIQIIRPYNIVGPRQQAKGGYVLPRFVEQAKRGKPLTIFGSGGQRRIFTSVHDLVDFVLLLIDKWPRKKTIFNVADPANTVSIRELAYLVRKPFIRNFCDNTSTIPITEAQSILNNSGYRDGFERYEVDISEAVALGWQPKWTLTDIIKEMLE